jgi:putative NADH-flavin reductase
MKLLILGATGGIGLEVVEQAVDRGHAVTAFVRSPESLRKFADRVAIVAGDLLNAAELGRVIKGHDAVLSSFGPREPLSKTDRALLPSFGQALTSAMVQASARRVIVVSAAFLFRDSIVPPTYLFGQLFFREQVAGLSEMEDAFQRSTLDWTIVRPPRLTKKPKSKIYRIQEGHLPRFGFTISRADVADFMIKAAESGASIGKIVGVCD